jgi:hypothetical protein
MGPGRLAAACVGVGALLMGMAFTMSVPPDDEARGAAPPPPAPRLAAGPSEAAPKEARTASPAHEGAADAHAGEPASSGPFGEREDAHRASLIHGNIARVTKGTGGRSLAFKITFEDGTRAYYKPHQSFSGSNWHAEVASYYLDRALGLGRVPPVVGRRLPWAALRRAAGGDERIDEVHVEHDGTVLGALIWWIPDPLPPLTPGAHWERWIRVAGAIDVSPLVAPYEWRRAVREGHGVHAGEPKAPDDPDRPAELSDMILFDYLTHNLDRWGGRFTNVRTRGPGGPLIYLDNAAGFFPGQHRIGLMDARLHVVQRFRRSTVEAIRAFDVDRFATQLAQDPLAPVLEPHYLEGLEVRRRHLLEHVDAMARRFGDDAFPW